MVETEIKIKGISDFIKLIKSNFIKLNCVHVLMLIMFHGKHYFKGKYSH